jgi:hypothetical protein
MKLVVVITLLSVLFGCCGHVFASKRAGSSSSHTNSERLITLINGRRPSHPTNLGGHHEGAAGHVNTRRRTAKSVPETNLDTIPASHSSPNEGGHHLTPPNLIINRHHEGDIFATTGKNEYCYVYYFWGQKLLFCVLRIKILFPCIKTNIQNT